MNVYIHSARNLRDLLLQFLGDTIVFRLVAAYYLHVNGSGQPEIQDLVGDVGGGKEKRLIGEFFRKGRSQLAHVAPSGMVVLPERDQDVPIAGSNSGAVAKGQIDPARRQ